MGLEICPVARTMTCPSRNSDCDILELAAHCHHVKAHKAAVATLALLVQCSGSLSAELDALLVELRLAPRTGEGAGVR